MILRCAICLLLLISGLISCMPEEEVLYRFPVDLRFSADTVNFDTLFTTEQSVTRRLRIYNPSNKAVLLESIRLRDGQDSPYTLLLNGIRGKNFGEQLLLGGDSLLVLLEARLPATSANDPYLASDALVVVNREFHQEVPVLGYGQNANMLAKSVLDCNTVWTSTRPYLVEDTLLVREGCTLTIEKGTRIFFKSAGTLIVQGTLQAEGDSANHILFQNNRLDDLYENVPGQWRGILFVEGSSNNLLRYCDIRNAEIGIRIGIPDDDDEPELVLEHCRLENHLQAGILAFTSDIEATNTLVANCFGPAVANLAGGSYRYIHCTFANFLRGQRDVPAVVFADNYPLPDNQLLTAPLQVVLRNSIVWGNLPSGSELALDQNGGAPATVALEHNLLRTANESFAGNGNILNTSLDFVGFQAPMLYNFRPDSVSPAVGAAVPLGLERDLSGRLRDANPDIGALEYFKEKE